MSMSPYSCAWLQPGGSTRPGQHLILEKAQIAAVRRAYRRGVRRHKAARRNDRLNTGNGTRKQRLGCSLRAPQRPSEDLNPKGVVDSVCSSKNLPPSIGSAEEYTGAPHRSSQDINHTDVVDSVGLSKNILPTVGSLEEYTTENCPRDAAVERELWIAAGAECYNFYKAEPATVMMNAGTLSDCGRDGRIQSQLDLQAVLAALPDVSKDQQTFQAGLRLGANPLLDDDEIRQLQEEWDEGRSLGSLSGSCRANIESTGESPSKATEEHSIITPSAVEMQEPGQKDSPMIVQSHPAAPQLEREVHSDCISNNRQGAEAPVDLQLDYVSHSNADPIVPSSQVLPYYFSVETRSVQPLPAVGNANFRLEGEKSMPVGLSVANHTFPNRDISSGRAPVLALTPDFLGNSISRVPIPVQGYPAHPLCSHPAPPDSHWTNPMDTTPTLETEKSAESGRIPWNLSNGSDQLSPLSVSKESLTTVAEEHATRYSGSGADSNPVRGGEESSPTRSSKKRPHEETPPVITHVVPDVYQESFKPILGHEYQDPLVKEKIYICNTMLGLENITNFNGLENSVNHILSVHQRCRKERKPFHIHRDCAFKEDASALDCCWLKQFRSISPDDKRIMRSFQQMCTKVVSLEVRNNHATYRIYRFPDWVNEEFKEFFKLHPEFIGNKLTAIREAEEFAESLGLEYRQVRNKIKNLRHAVAEDKKFQERQVKGESPRSAGNSDREIPDAIPARNFGPQPQTSLYRDRNVKRRAPSRSQLPKVGGRYEPNPKPE